MADWIDELAVEIQQRQEMVDRIEANADKILDALRVAIQEDIDRVHKELYDNHSKFEIEDSPVPFYDFRVIRNDINFEAQVRLSADDLALHCTFQPRGRGFDFEVGVDRGGNFSFFEGRAAIPIEEISRLILEPSIRGGFNLN